MRFLVAVLYTALALTANTAHADVAKAESLREGTMKKLLFSEARPVSTETFTHADGGEFTLGDFAGKHVLVNFWATWCAPCRKEMPQLAEIQDEFGGDNFEVVTIATGRNSPAGIQKFFEETGISNLPRHQDPKQALASQMGIFGLPITVLIDPEGREIARLRGDADWSSDSAKAILATILDKNS